MVAIARPLPRQRALPAWVRPWMRTKIYIGGLIVLGLILLGLFWCWKSHSSPTLMPQPAEAAK